MKIYWNGHSKNIIGNRLKELRTAQGISQKTLAARLHSAKPRKTRVFTEQPIARVYGLGAGLHRRRQNGRHI